MIERHEGQVVFECDACPEELETDEDDFHTALALFKREGWKAEKVGSEWVHTCPSCQHDEAKRAFRRG